MYQILCSVLKQKCLLSAFLKSRNLSRIACLRTLATGLTWQGDDYQFLNKSSIPTMHFQKSLLRLPVPELEKTCDRYLLAQKALLSEDDYKASVEAVEEFRKGSGLPLQYQLKTWDQNNKHTSYVSKPWFEMYLKDRVSVVLNYNPFLGFLPPDATMTDPVIRATNLLVSSARFLRSLRANVLKPEVYHLNPSKSDSPFYWKITGLAPQMFASYVSYAFKAFPLDMSQFVNLFNSTRIPQRGIDTFSSDSNARHILVMKNGNFYVFDILDDNGHIYSPNHIYSCMRYIACDESPRPTHPLGYLTTENRDTWAQVRAELASAGNSESLRAVDHAAFNIVFDDAVLNMDPEKAYRTFLYGDGGNRWFDKSFSIIFTKDGQAALNFEHAWGDGVAVMRYFNEVASEMQTRPYVTAQTTSAEVDPSQYVRKLEWRVPDSVRTAVEAARQQYDVATSAIAVHILESDVIGKNFCKKHQVSPDAIMQLGFQVAYRLQYGGVAATYESCSTSAFKHGRTETIRPATLQTRAFSEAVCGASGSVQLGPLVRECSRVHGELTKQAAMGLGFDRHLFALRHLAEAAGNVPALYRDAAYAKINHNIISTSTLPSNLISFGGFAPVVRDGFGVGYQIQDEKLGLVVSSYPPHRDGAEFVKCAQKAYFTIRDALVAG